MGTGYTRNDTANNIADGNVINASDLDGEFDAIQSAFNASTGHSHDGTTGEGPQIGAAGIANLAITTGKIANDAVTLGTKTSGNYVATGAVSGVGLSGSASAEGATFTVTSNATDANTASTIVARDASGNFSAGTITAAVTGNVTGNLTGNASTASAWQTGRSITLTGDVTGTATGVDGSGNVSISTTIAADSLELGTDTTGNYVAAGATSGNGISGSVSSEGGTFTVTSNATNLNTASTLVYRDASGNFSAGTITAALTGNSSTATALQTARTIAGVSFDGTANIAIASSNLSDGSSLLKNVVEDTTPQLGGDLDLNSNNITGTGNIPAANLTGTLPAIDGSNLTGIVSDLVNDTTPQLGGDLDLNSSNITGTGNIDNTGTITTDGLTVDGNTDISGGSIKLSGVYPTGNFNTALGYLALENITTGQHNVAVGYTALTSMTNDNDNTAIGYRALQASNGSSSNTVVGSQSSDAITTGSNNVSVGTFSLTTNITGSANTAIGSGSLFNCTAGNNTAVGYSAGNSITTGSNNTCIGYDADASSATTSNEFTLGNSSVATLRCQVTTITSLSDERDKTNIAPLDAGIDFVKGLKPVSFDWNTRDGAKVGIADTGFIAQDLQQVQEDTGVTIPYLVMDDNPEKLEAGYGKLLPVLVKAIQEQQQTIEALEARVAALEAN